MTTRLNRGGCIVVAALAFLIAAAPSRLAAQVQPTGALEGMKAPEPDVPEIFTLMGQYVRVAYNHEGFANLGYRMAQQELGKPWALLVVGLSLREKVDNEKLTREDLTLQTPDGKTIPLASQKEYMAAAGPLKALNARAKVVQDSINYFPVGATQACPIQFFAELDRPGIAYDQVELSPQRGCVGRLYFNIPGGIQPGQHWFNVKFANSVVKVPFRIFTKEEEKDFKKQWQDLKKAHDASNK
jgi:hypothetical protein